jgi:hypothetical protein
MQPKAMIGVPGHGSQPVVDTGEGGHDDQQGNRGSSDTFLHSLVR